MTTVPNSTDFCRLARDGVAVPVVRELDFGLVDPLSAFETLAGGSEAAALLETSEAADGDADISIVAPRATRVLRGHDVLEQVRRACADEVARIGIDLPRFVGGAIGMLGHEHVRTIEPRVGVAAGAHPAGAPEEAFLLVDTILVFEHRRRRLLAIHVSTPQARRLHADDAAAHDHARAALDEVEQQLRAAVASGAAVPVEAMATGSETDPTCSSNLPPGRFQELVRQAREHVRSGECVQIVVSQRFDMPVAADPVDAYRAMRAVSPAPYHALLRVDGIHIVGASPEQLVGVVGERVVTHPIAGTRPRGEGAEQDARLEAELLADPKERSEHMMLVDLGRNDVGRSCEPGTVRVPRLCEVERFSHVMHLVSRVEGRLRAGLHPVDALRAAFPAGTLTGAPKVRAMELISQLEPDRRGPYGGVVGYVGHGRVLDMAITIRTAVIADGVASVQAGAGVVADSDPAAEEAETRHKARAMLRALARAEQRAATGALVMGGAA